MSSVTHATRTVSIVVRGNREGGATVRLGADGSDLKHEHVRRAQRRRIIVSAGQVACEQGAAGVTVAQIVLRAGVSRRTFYELFACCEECLLAVLQDALSRVRERTFASWASQEDDWRGRARSSLAGLLGLFDEDHVLAQLLIVESLSAGSHVLAVRARVLEEVIDALEQQVCRPEAKGKLAGTEVSSTFTRLSLEGAIGGMLAVLHARISLRTSGNLLELIGPLMGMLVLPVYGPAAARREAARPVFPLAAKYETNRRSRSLLHSDPFKDAGMRLTYRTIRVLWAIGDHPGSSNRQVATLAEVADQGQVSKLLSRLEYRGIIANSRVEAGPGRPNAWTLTLAGRQLISRIESHPLRG